MPTYNCKVQIGDKVRVKDIDTKRIVYNQEALDIDFNITLVPGRYLLIVRGEGSCYNKEFSLGTTEELNERVEVALGPRHGMITRKGTRYDCSNKDCDFKTLDESTLVSHEIKHRQRAKSAKAAEVALQKAAATVSAAKDKLPEAKPVSLSDALNE